MSIFVWQMHTPQCVFHGRNSVVKLKEVIGGEKLARPFVVIDKKVEATAFGEEIKNILSPYQAAYWKGFTSDPTLTQGENGADACQGFNGDGIIVVGGGSAIDVAKYISLITGTAFVAAVPTTCGTGAESSPVAIITEEKNIRKKAFRDPRFIPKFVILDGNALNSLERELVAATALDTLAHVMETHMSRQSTALVRVSTRGSLVTLGENLEGAIYHQDPQALEALQDVAFTARLLYPGTGLSIIHSLAHPLGAYTGLHHGMAVAFLTPACLEYNRPFCPELMGEMEFLLNVPGKKFPCAGAWIQAVIAGSGMGEEIRKKLKGVGEIAAAIVEQAMESSNIPSNPRPVKGQEELRGVLVDACTQGNVGWAG